ncbi:charged multivesicular body protein 4c isoform X1 [Dromaius novaehollandiae]|uniref:charged multivesicular body protein 4c isoform X1 n=1 Tax=Dromaius novaehollandiae TaxID=8790 RepID=UPI00311D5762
MRHPAVLPELQLCHFPHAAPALRKGEGRESRGRNCRNSARKGCRTTGEDLAARRRGGQGRGCYVDVEPRPGAGSRRGGRGLGGAAALQALKRKKRYEKQLSQIDGTLSTIEFQREALENSYTNTEVLKNMGYAAQAMKKAHENMDLNKIDDLMQDIIEQQDVAQEISDAISNRAGFGDEFDEGELMAELEELEQEEMNKTMTNVRLPSVPSTSLPSRPASTRKKAEDEDEMKRLAAWAS